MSSFRENTQQSHAIDHRIGESYSPCCSKNINSIIRANVSPEADRPGLYLFRESFNSDKYKLVKKTDEIRQNRQTFAKFGSAITHKVAPPSLRSSIDGRPSNDER